MKNVEKIKLKLKSHDIDGIFITSPYNISYLTNLFPSTIEEREYYILITKNKAFLLAPKMFLMAVKEKTEDFNYIEITAENGLYKNIVSICEEHNIKTLGFEENNILYKEFDHLQEALSTIELIPLEDFVEDERQIKTSEEIEKIKKACEITDICFTEMTKRIKLGITEKELKAEIEFYLNKFGGIAFSPIVAFGKNSAIPHHVSTEYKLEANSFVLLDFGAKYEGYCSDMSRTIYLGNPNEKVIKLYNSILEAQQMSLEKLKEWMIKDFEVSHLHTIAESHIEKNGFPAFPHSLGHGVGLQVHESPSISKFSVGNDLSENMIITIEPATYVPEIGGVRIEDNILITKSGFEVLSKSNKELIVIK